MNSLVQEDVDDGRDVLDVHLAVIVGIGIVNVDTIGRVAQQVIDEGSDVPDGHLAIAIRIARKCLRIVYENIVFAIGVKLLCLLLGALGLAGMGLAIFADVGVMVLCVLNAIRALRVKNL